MCIFMSVIMAIGIGVRVVGVVKGVVVTEDVRITDPLPTALLAGVPVGVSLDVCVVISMSVWVAVCVRDGVMVRVVRVVPFHN